MRKSDQCDEPIECMNEFTVREDDEQSGNEAEMYRQQCPHRGCVSKHEQQKPAEACEEKLD